MDANAQPDKVAILVAEEILRVIYGDDFQGCTVNLEKLTPIIELGIQQRVEQDRDMLEMYEKLIEALHLLSTPPEPGQVTEPNELRSLLSERLDTIHALTSKTLDTHARLKAERKGKKTGGV